MLLTFGTLWENSAGNALMIVFLFWQKTGVDISWKLSPEETIFMKCQPVFTAGDNWNVKSCFLILTENRRWHFMKIVSWGDNFHEMSACFYSRRQLECWILFSYFDRKQALTFHENCLLRRQFSWNVSLFLQQETNGMLNPVFWIKYELHCLLKVYPDCSALMTVHCSELESSKHKSASLLDI